MSLERRVVEAGNLRAVSRSIRVMANESPTFVSATVARVRIRLGVKPARESWAVSAIVKQPARAAPMSSSGFVAD